MRLLLDALAQTALDLLIGFAFLSALCALFVLALYGWYRWDERERRRWLEFIQRQQPATQPVDFAGEIKAYRIARDREEAGGRWAIR